MRHSAKTTLRIVFTLAVILISSHTVAQEQPDGNQTPETKRDVAKSAPDLADLIPLATKLTENLATLENRVAGGLDISEFEENYNRIEEDLKDPAAQLQQIIASKDAKLNKLVEIREAIEAQNELLE